MIELTALIAGFLVGAAIALVSRNKDNGQGFYETRRRLRKKK